MGVSHQHKVQFSLTGGASDTLVKSSYFQDCLDVQLARTVLQVVGGHRWAVSVNTRSTVLPRCIHPTCYLRFNGDNN